MNTQTMKNRLMDLERTARSINLSDVESIFRMIMNNPDDWAAILQAANEFQNQ